MAVVTYTYTYSGNFNLEIEYNKASGDILYTIRNTNNNNVVATFTAVQLHKLLQLNEEFQKLRNNNELVSVVVT